MEKIQLLVFLTIKGIGSASGIVFNNDSLFIISDNSSYLYEYLLGEEKLNRIALLTPPQENIEKKEKPDFEAITLKDAKLHLFGSGSTEKRMHSISYDLLKNKIGVKDLKPLYQEIKLKFAIADDVLNIEGAFYHNTDLYLFQRGNGGNSTNGIIKVEDNDFSKITFHAIILPKIKHVETTFTDAILVKDTIYFLAAAEDTTSTYEDGEVLGSILGKIDLKTLTLEETIQISDKHKFEGLTLNSESEKEIEFLLCEDNDTEELNTTIYKLKLITDH